MNSPITVVEKSPEQPDPATLKTAGFKPIDRHSLYRVETFTDHAVGDIRMTIPVTFGDPLGAPVDDPSRPLRFFSSMVATINGMPNTVAFEIEAATLSEAIEKMPAAAERAGREFIKQVQAARASRPVIIPPGMSGLPS